MTKAELKLLKPLTQKISLYIPTNVEGKIIDNSDMTKKAASFFSDLFGGASVMKISGVWNGWNGVTFEDINLVYSFAEELDDESIDEVFQFAADMKKEMRQEAVSVEINNALYLI